MMNHPNTVLLSKIYNNFTEGKFSEVLDACADNITFQIAGKSKLAGKYNKTNFITDFAHKLKEISNGTYKLEVHDILASDLHAAVLTSSKVTTLGKEVELRTVHIWRFDHGKPIAWYEYSRDLYSFDAVWG